MDITIPKTFTLTRHSPTINELNFLREWLKNNIKQESNVLEFGAGPTTWVIATTVNPKKYVVVEDYIPSLHQLLDHLTDINIVKGIWYCIPEDVKYDFIFVDSSAGYPPGGDGLHRDEAVKYGERLLSKGGHIAIHDWHGRSGKAARNYLEKSGKYKLIDSITDRTGLGIYQSVS